MRGVESHQFARRTDQHLSGAARLHVERDRRGAKGVRALQVAEFDQLMPNQPGSSIGDHEVALARHDRQPRHQRGRRDAGGDDDRCRAEHAYRRASRTLPGASDSARARTLTTHAAAGRPLGQRPRNRRRIAHGILRDQEAARQTRAASAARAGTARAGRRSSAATPCAAYPATRARAIDEFGVIGSDPERTATIVFAVLRQ